MIEQGDVYWVDMDPGQTTEKRKTRPVVVIQASDLTKAGKRSITVVPLTSRLVPSNKLRLRIDQELIPNLGKETDVLVDEVHTLHQSRLTQKIGQLPHGFVESILEGVAFLLRSSGD